MTIRLDAIGRQAEVTHELTPRWLLAYAASLGFCDERFLDDARPGGPIVPPMFCCCLEWALAGENRERILELDADERRNAVHVLQDSRFFRPLRSGMTVVTTSTIEFMRATSAGIYILTRYDHRQPDGGGLLASSFHGAMIRGGRLGVASAGRLPDDLSPPKSAEGAMPNGCEVRMARTLPLTYSECARIWNPIHSERAVALRAGLPDIIVHGTITWALAAAEIARRQGCDIAALRRLSVRFRNPIVAGATMMLSYGNNTSDGAVRFGATDTSGNIALADGLASWA